MLLPCRNAAATLPAALSSLTAQNFASFEIIAVDDGSSDDTWKILTRVSDTEKRLVRLQQPPLGIVAALNAAAEVARGELLARMDADDIALPERIARQVELLDSDDGLAACGTQVRYIPRSKVLDGALRYESWINGLVSPEEIERDLFVECPIPHPTLMMRREEFEKVGGYRDAGWPEDYDLIFRLWESGARLGKVADVLLEWREHPERLSRVDGRYSEGAFRRCKAHFLKHRIKQRSVVVWGAGPVGKAFALELQRLEHRVAAFVDLDPRKIGQTIHGAPVIHPQDIDSYRGSYVVAAVGSHDARREIRAAWKAGGFKEPEECCAVA